jgi:hypothetical protein
VDAVALPKDFDRFENGSRYVHRTDKVAMVTYLQEAFCLCQCQRVINIGGFLNESAANIWRAPYADAPLVLTNDPR